MKPSHILALFIMGMTIALCLIVKQPEPNNLSGDGVESRNALTIGGDIPRNPASTGRGRMNEDRSHSRDSVRLAAQSSINPEAKRIIAELVAEGWSQEDAAEAIRMVNEMARIERNTRPPMPGVRTTIDTNRFPLFE